ncbi:MAG: radical SAM protein [Pseudothermotoga sp.]
MKEKMYHCDLCPVECGVNRHQQVGKCGIGVAPKLMSALLHFGEEPPISGESGAGTIFFSGCNLRCVYCQNMNFSQKANGVEVTVEQLAEIFLDLQNHGAKTLNLVTPTPHLLSIIEALSIAKDEGFTLSVVYNTSSYESVETLKLIDGIVDVYLADLKYADNETGYRYSGVKDYYTVASAALIEMHRQVGAFREFDGRPRGLIVRHLVLPNNAGGSEKVLDFVFNCLSPKVPVSLMSQYNPLFGARSDQLIGRKITKEEYEMVINLATQLNMDGWIQTDEKKRVTVKPIPWTYKIIELLRSKT